MVEMFKLLLVSDRSFLNRSIDELTLGQITEAIDLDSGSILHLLGGVSLDKEKRIAGELTTLPQVYGNPFGVLCRRT